MRTVQIFARRDAHKLGFNFGGRFAGSQAGAIGDAEDVGIHRDCAFAEDLHQHDICRLSSNTRQRFQRLARARHFAVVLRDKRLGEGDDVFRLVAPKAYGLDVIGDAGFA